jgi:hypothetical protein
MCLFPMGGGGSMQPVVPPTEEGNKQKSRLYIVLFTHLALSIMMMFVNVASGFFELINVLILWCATA